MNIEDAMRYDEYYRLKELSDDPDVGTRLQMLIESEQVLNTIKKLIMKVNREEGLQAAKWYLLHVYRSHK
jgi:hypothetical protein